MILKKEWKDNKAALSIEAAIVVPIVLVFVGAFYLYILSIRVDLIYQEAAYSAIREFELLLTISQEDINNNVAKGYREKLNKLLENRISAKALNLRQKHWLKRNINTSIISFFIKNEKYNLFRDQVRGLEYKFSYTGPRILGGKTYTYRLPIPYWGGLKIASLEIDDRDEGVESIWSEHNLLRGKYFRDKYGANLPYSYPVIAKINGETITSIKSMDLTAPSYKIFENLEDQVNSHARKLVNFSGTKNWGKDNITIDIHNIKTRKLLIIIPQNSDTSAKLYIDKLKSQWSQNGVIIEVIEDGISEKFE